MESPNFLSSSISILRESRAIFVKNRNLMAYISVLILLLNSSLLLCNFLSFKPLIKDTITQETPYMQSGTTDYLIILLAMAANFRTFAGLIWFFNILALSVASLFSSAIINLASATIYGELNLSFKDLLLIVLKSWKRPLATLFYIALFDIGYVTFVLFSFLPFVFNFGSPFELSIFYVILILAGTFYIYLDVFGKVSIVIAVLEQKSGVEAIGKATQLMKGMKMQGFLLNVLFEILVFLLFECWDLISVKSESFMLLVLLLITNVACLIKMQAWMAFTVFYYVSKQSHGEEIELQGDLEYTKVSTHEPLNTAEIP